MAAPAAAASGGHVTSRVHSFVGKGVISASVPRPCGTTRRVNRWLRCNRDCWAICACNHVESTKSAPKSAANFHLATTIDLCWFIFSLPTCQRLLPYRLGKSREEGVKLQWGLGEDNP